MKVIVVPLKVVYGNVVTVVSAVILVFTWSSFVAPTVTSGVVFTTQSSFTTVISERWRRMTKRSLLILSCSSRKHEVTGNVAAWDLYDGVAFRVVKRAQRERWFPQNVDILILSAQYGLIRPTQKIAFYDRRMTHTLALAQATRNCKFLERFLQTGGYVEVFVNAGQTYLTALQPIKAWLPNGTALTIAGGGIGMKMQQMKAWLLSKSSC
jgi:hypothetical protein